MSTSRILKHVLRLERVQVVEVPIGSRALSAALQPTPEGGAQVVMWTVGPAHGPVVRRRVVMMQTGHAVNGEIEAACTHVATISWLVGRRDAHGNVQQRALTEHVWIEREPETLN
jgi:hypothetical protein